MNPSKAVLFALQPEVAVVLDIDGTLAVYEFGDSKHSACNNMYWEDFVKEQHPYDNIPAVPQLQSFVRDKAKTEQGRNNLFVCSVSEEYERENKKSFVNRNYPEIPDSNIIFVNTKQEKLDVLHNINKTKAQDIAIVDDTVKTLDNIFENSDYYTIHVSSFFTYPVSTDSCSCSGGTGDCACRNR